MAILKIANRKGKYFDRNAYRKLIRYATGYESTGGVPAILCGVTSAEEAALQMEVISKSNRNEGLKLRHMILSFDESERVNLRAAQEIAARIADYYANDYQMVAGIHTNTDHLHIHFIMNVVNYHTGAKYTGRKQEFEEFRFHVKYVVRDVLGRDDIKVAFTR